VGAVYFSPATADGKVYVGSLDWSVYCLNASTGIYMWSYVTGSQIYSSPSVASGKVFIGSDDNKIYAFSTKRDVTITSVTPSKTIVGRGCPLIVNVTVGNLGDLAEDVVVTLLCDEMPLATETVINLLNGDSANVSFYWEANVDMGNYTIAAKTKVLTGETVFWNNAYTDGWIFVTIPGDVNGDRKCDMQDIFQLILHYGCEKPQPCYVANYDINDDGKTDLLDLFTAILHYGEEW